MRIPFLDLTAQYRSIRPAMDAAVLGVLESGSFILGANVSAFETEAAAYLGVPRAIGVASGTDALLLPLEALGVGAGSEVIVPTFTFFATAEVVSRLGARPVFVDIDPVTYAIDPAAIAAAITPRTRAIVPVHLFGHPAPMDEILAIAARHGLAVIEDNAQAFGASYRGKRTGSLGVAGAMSFFPTKNLGGAGDGGMVVTSDAALAERIEVLRSHGWRRKYEPEVVGTNSRLDEIQAAILRVKLVHLERWNQRRRAIAAAYGRLLAGIPDLRLPVEAPGAHHAYNVYTIATPRRDAVSAALHAAGIGHTVYYPFALHQTPVYAKDHRAGAFPVAERAASECLALPIYAEMEDAQVETVAAAVRQALAAAAGETS